MSVSAREAISTTFRANLTVKPDDFRGFQVSALTREQASNEAAIANRKNLNGVRVSAFKADFFTCDAFAAAFVDGFMFTVLAIIRSRSLVVVLDSGMPE